ncbi:MAG TPA: hypothetical protein PKJ63_08625 [Cyclobacteriaceae bacterium]|nr:hypothetical protein [Cyclobacteriaceae bacterium]
MEGIVFALIIFCVVVLIVSIIYITNTLRHKERMALLDKGKEPDYFNNDQYMLGVIKWGLILFCAGAGFLTAFLTNHFLFTGDQGEPLFPSLVLMGAGTGLIIFYTRFKKGLR